MPDKRLEEIRSARLKKRQFLLDQKLEPYPAEARRTHTTQQLTDSFEDLQASSNPIVLAGRITSLRTHGGLVFIDLADAYGSFQLQVTKADVEPEIFELTNYLDTGDFLEAAGTAIMTKRGTKTLRVISMRLLSKSIRPIPAQWFGLHDTETRFRERELDLLLNEQARRPLLIRSEVIDWLRQFLKKEGFLEVETPILQPLAGGALAKPFVTHHSALNIDLYLRIAPELYLKRLLVGGLEKVFEIGRNFRNEGIDHDHNPEFTMCEFYWAYADYEDLMDLTERMLSAMPNDIGGSRQMTYRGRQLSFAPPWSRVRFVDLFQQEFNIDVLAVKETSVYVDLLKKHGLAIPVVQTYQKLVEELYKEKIRPKLVQPTLLYDWPLEMAPLAKTKNLDHRIAEVLQLIIAGTEIVKAYTELNDPIEQRQRFQAQQTARRQGDTEASEIDELYLKAMEYGMPPAAGWGMGIDRLAALLSDAPSIRDTISFPLLRPEPNKVEKPL